MGKAREADTEKAHSPLQWRKQKHYGELGGAEERNRRESKRAGRLRENAERRQTAYTRGGADQRYQKISSAATGMAVL